MLHIVPCSHARTITRRPPARERFQLAVTGIRRSSRSSASGDYFLRGRAASMFTIAIATHPNTRRGNRMHPRFLFLTTLQKGAAKCDLVIERPQAAVQGHLVGMVF